MNDFIIENFEKEEVVQIIMMYLRLYKDLGDEKFGCKADDLIRSLSNECY